MSKSYDTIWNELGKRPNRYPYDFVVSFVYKYRPRDIPADQIRILEVGCSGGNNLWFAAREGFQVAGLDGSQAAIDYAQRRFKEERLKGDLRQGDFTVLPWQDESFHLVIDRGGVTCTSYSNAQKTLSEVHRVLKFGGKFLFNPYSDQHSSATNGKAGEDSLTVNIKHGNLVGVGQICFYSTEQVDALLQKQWLLLQKQYYCLDDQIHGGIDAEWRLVLQKA